MGKARKGDDKKWIDEANKRMAAAGKKSRYIDEASEEDYTLAGDEQLAERVNPLEDIPPEILAKGEVMRRLTLEEMERRGLTPGGSRDAIHVDSSPRAKRIDTVRKLLAQQRALGFGYERLEDELKELTDEE